MWAGLVLLLALLAPNLYDYHETVRIQQALQTYYYRDLTCPITEVVKAVRSGDKDAKASCGIDPWTGFRKIRPSSIPLNRGTLRINKQGDVLVLFWSTFHDPSLVEDSLRAIRSHQPKSIVINLAGNDGGITREGEEANCIFNDRDVPYLQTRNKKGSISIARPSQSSSYICKQNFGELSNLPLVIYVDQESASTTEMFVRATRRRSCGVVVVGSPTFGKGVIQNRVAKLGDVALWVTTKEVIDEDGRSLHGTPIVPDVPGDLGDAIGIAHSLSK